MTGPRHGKAAAPTAANAQISDSQLAEFYRVVNCEMLPSINAAAMVSDRKAAGIDDGMTDSDAFAGISANLHRALRQLAVIS